MQPQLSKDTYIVPHMTQEEVDARFAEIVPIVPKDQEMAELERRVVAAYDAYSEEPNGKSSGVIGGFVVDTARQETHQPAEHILDPERGEQLGPVQMAAKATAAVVKMREDYTLGA